jgi:hypothetical protein
MSILSAGHLLSLHCVKCIVPYETQIAGASSEDLSACSVYDIFPVRNSLHLSPRSYQLKLNSLSNRKSVDRVCKEIVLYTA